MFGIVDTNENIDLEQLHPAYKPKRRNYSFGDEMSEWPEDKRDTYETWKHFMHNNYSFPDIRKRSPSHPRSVRRSISRHSSVETDLSRTPSLEIPIVQKRISLPVPKEPTGAEVLIDFDGKDDPYRPMNWPFKKKVITTALYGLTTCWVTFASAVYSAGVEQIAHDFDVPLVVATAGISMVVFGFGLGPLLWAPLSEV